MSELNADFVHRGYWVNRSQGPIMGRTITADAQTGLIITAILAICTTIGSTHLWYIFTFLFHQLRARGLPRDGMYRQQQALLRTLPSPSTTVVESIKLFFAWRKHAPPKGILGRSLYQMAVAFIFMILSLAAGIFSSYVVASANLEVLVNSPLCGLFWSHESPATLYAGQVMTAATQYAESCYLSGSTSNQCLVFTNPRIGYSKSNASCPFSPDLCASQAVAFDSGLVDLNEAFGLNLADADRVNYRKKTTCAILSDRGRTRLVNVTDMPKEFIKANFPQEEAILYSWSNRRTGTLSKTQFANTTFTYSLLTGNFTSQFLLDRQLFKMNTAGKTADSFELDPKLSLKDADTTIIAVAKTSISYRKQIDDPFFSAHKPYTVDDRASASNLTLYISDTPTSTFGCTEQFQACVAVDGKPDSCTRLGPIYDAQGITQLEGTPTQRAYLRILKAAGDSFRLRGMQRLNASSLAVNGVIDNLPNDHWISELDRWNAVLWASHQIVLSDFAAGPGARDRSLDYEHPPADPQLRSLCTAQKMRKSGGFVNINVFGLVFILVISITLTLIDFCLLRFFIFLSKFRKTLSPRVDRWIQDGIYQLQSRAYEAEGKGTWTRLNDEIPVIIDGTELSDLPQRPIVAIAGFTSSRSTTLQTVIEK